MSTSQEDNQSSKTKTLTASVTLNAPPTVPNYEFLQQRVNTKMTFCGDLEQLVNDGATTKLIMAQGHLSLLLDEKVQHSFEAFLHKNVCVQGFLTPLGEGFQMVISEPGQIWPTGF
jgi:hypothetical protein